MSIHASIDLETIDTKPSATVLSLGGVKFDPKSNDEPHSEFYIKICVCYIPTNFNSDSINGPLFIKRSIFNVI